MRFLALPSLALVFIASLAAAPAAEKPGASMLGFSAQGEAAERSLEAKFDAQLNPDHLRDWMKRLTAHPHHVGSPWGKANAEWLVEQFRAWGYDTKIEEFQVLFPTPRRRLLEMTAPARFTAALAEPPLSEDSTSNQTAEQLPTYNAYSVDGDVTGDLVYVNYGVPKDYEELAQHGIDLKGKIALARYGGSWRGIKPKVAAEHGAVGCIIYSDPHDDGYFEGDVYPQGAYRNERGAQRGSVADMPLYAGDPLTPGVGATKEAKRLGLQDAQTLTKIPVLPISYADALPLLKALGGPVAPETWRGSLPVTYHLGPGPARVHLELAFDWSLKPIRDVIAMLPGAEFPDQWILRGNHHDAWVNGAEDPVSGLVAMLEEARAIAELAKQGLQPKRTLVYAAWDGEEPGLLGSTEWVETHADLLRQKAAVYINSDNSGRGFLAVSGSHSLERLVNQVARDVPDPQRGISVGERWRDLRLVRGETEIAKEARERADLRIGALGSGSDYTPFLQHLGVAALDVRYSGENDGGSYHSIYDSFDYYVRFGDPRFAYGIAQAKTAGRIALRLANAEVLPLEFTDFADTVAKYAKEVEKLADDARSDIAETNRKLRDKAYEAVADPTQVYVAPAPKDPAPYLNFAPLQNAVARLHESAAAYQGAVEARGTKGAGLAPRSEEELDRLLAGMEHALTVKEGLPGRPWYIHAIYAPGRYTGYGVKTLPGVREAIELRSWKQAEEQIGVVAGVLNHYCDELDRAAELNRRAGSRVD